MNVDFPPIFGPVIIKSSCSSKKLKIKKQMKIHSHIQKKIQSLFKILYRLPTISNQSVVAYDIYVEYSTFSLRYLTPKYNIYFDFKTLYISL